ncbi:MULTISPECIES: polysaccharide biosynthesis/export family protein [Rubritalea]|nr:polysaccharide biosynthesis/export family protein [Rubritalea squalenifaciens]
MIRIFLLLLVLLFSGIPAPLFSQIKTGDTLHISIKGVPAEDKGQIDGKYQVGESGKIKLPITGSMISVRGLSNEQVCRKIENSYKAEQIYQEPVIEVINMVKDDPQVQSLTVGGQVRRPGAVVWKKGLTLQQALQLAGDKTQFGSKYVYVTRKGKMSKYNTKILEHQNVLVEPNDTITVKHKGPFEVN